MSRLAVVDLLLALSMIGLVVAVAALLVIVRGHRDRIARLERLVRRDG